MRTRRVVTGHSADSKAVFASDSLVEPHGPATVFQFVKLWGAESLPSFPDAGQPSTYNDFFPPIGGFRFGIFTVPAMQAAPLSKEQRKAAHVHMEEVFPGLPAHMEPTTPGMHTSDSIDFGYVISGNICLELDDGSMKELTGGRHVCTERDSSRLAQSEFGAVQHPRRAHRSQTRAVWPVCRTELQLSERTSWWPLTCHSSGRPQARLASPLNCDGADRPLSRPPPRRNGPATASRLASGRAVPARSRRSPTTAFGSIGLALRWTDRGWVRLIYRNDGGRCVHQLPKQVNASHAGRLSNYSRRVGVGKCDRSQECTAVGSRL